MPVNDCQATALPGVCSEQFNDKDWVYWTRKPFVFTQVSIQEFKKAGGWGESRPSPLTEHTIESNTAASKSSLSVRLTLNSVKPPNSQPYFTQLKLTQTNPTLLSEKQKEKRKQQQQKNKQIAASLSQPYIALCNVAQPNVSRAQCIRNVLKRIFLKAVFVYQRLAALNQASTLSQCTFSRHVRMRRAANLLEQNCMNLTATLQSFVQSLWAPPDPLRGRGRGGAATRSGFVGFFRRQAYASSCVMLAALFFGCFDLEGNVFRFQTGAVVIFFFGLINIYIYTREKTILTKQCKPLDSMSFTAFYCAHKGLTVWNSLWSIKFVKDGLTDDLRRKTWIPKVRLNIEYLQRTLFPR